MEVVMEELQRSEVEFLDKTMCSRIIELAKIFYSDPKNRAEFEKWKAKQNKASI